jgi:uncharacterized protein DUF4942
MIPGTDIVRKNSIEELCLHRARALELYERARALLMDAQQEHKLACANQSYITTDFCKDIHREGAAGRLAKEARLSIDRDMWRSFIIGTPLGSLMDEQERKRFEESLRSDPPEITPDTVFATMSRLAADAEMIFRRGLVNAFSHFCRDFKSHDGFKIGPRFVVTSLLQGNWLNHYRDAQVQDIDRCMHVLDGKESPTYQQGVLAAIRTTLYNHENEVTSDYFRVRLFRGNGNAHFYPLRTDLVERANKLLADHFGETLGQGHAAANRRA